MDVISKTKTQYSVVKKLIKEASTVIISSDADREGELLAREILDQCRYKGPIKRLWLSSLDDKSIKKALSDIRPGASTEALYAAGLGRARADWLVGMNLTRLFTKITNAEKTLSVGRVQSPTLKLIVDRDREIENFVPKDYFELFATFATTNDHETFTAKWQVPEKLADDAGHCPKLETAKNVQDEITNQQGTIEKAETNRKKQSSPQLFSLSSLQQIANSRFGFTADQTLQIAQSLYEIHKATTYPRSDCNYLPDEQHSEAKDVLNAIKQTDQSIGQLVDNADPNRKSKWFNTKKITAHHAIIPTSTPTNIGKMSADELNIYKLVRDRYIALFYPDYEYDEAVIIVNAKGYTFIVKGRTPMVQGWKSVILEDKQDNDKEELKPILPHVTVGEVVDVKKSDLKAQKTKPPQRFTEGTLIEAMKSIARHVESTKHKKILKETAGIGTEATRSQIIKVIIERNYVKVEKKKLLSTQTGRTLIEILPESVTDPTTTAMLEEKLDAIAHNSGSLDGFIEVQKQTIVNIIIAAKSDGKANIDLSNSKYKCEKCGKPLRLRPGKKGKFWACSGYPDCKNTFPDNKGTPDFNKALQPQSDANHQCPKCNNPLRLRNAKYGEFWGCSEFPKCSYTADNIDGKPTEKQPTQQENSGFTCPECKSALKHLQGTSGKTGKDYNFWKCSKCKFIANNAAGQPDLKQNQPKQTDVFNCPECKSALKHLQGTSGKTGKEYNFWKCSKCKFISNDSNDRPQKYANSNG